MANSHFEARARAAKVARLVRLITEMVAYLGLAPERDGYLIAELVRGWGDKEWTSAAINIGKTSVGVESRLAVIAHFIEKARKAS